jgi:hypothetical protein
MAVYNKIKDGAGDDFYLGYSTSSSDEDEEQDGNDDSKNKKT